MTFPDWSLVLIVVSWGIRLVMIPIVVTRKEEPQTCLAWLMIVFFEPWIGLPLYLLIGEDRIVRRRLKWRQQSGRDLDEEPTAVSPLDTDAIELPMLASLGEQAGGLPALSGNSVQLLCETEPIVDRLVSDIDQATDHVHLLFYIFADDATGDRVCEALLRAQARGVECRVLADAVGSRPFFRTQAVRLRDAGVEVYDCLPVGVLRRSLARIDMRNHRKLALIDGRIAWTGSQNIVDDTYGHRKAGRWRDVMIRVTGPIVRQFQITFLEDWYHESRELLHGERYFPDNRDDGSVTMQVVPSGPDQPTARFQSLIVEAIHSARKNVTITSPYFIPDESLVCALRLAVMRGVKVDVIIPRRSDHWLIDFATSFYIGQLLRDGIRIHRFEQGLLHAKTMCIDEDYGLLGSANFDIRSFHLNFEINVSLFDRHAIRELKWVQDNYRSGSTEVTREEWSKRPHWKKLGSNLAKLFSSLL